MPSFPDDDLSRHRPAESAEDELTSLQVLLQHFRRGPADVSGAEPVTLVTDQGEIHTRYYTPRLTSHLGVAQPASAARPYVAGAVFLRDVGGGDDGERCEPQGGRLYAGLCEQLSAAGVAGLRVAYRRTGDFAHCVLDVLAALAFLDEQDVGPVALVGHGFGAAVAVHAALLSPVVVTCACLAPMAFEEEEAEYLGPRCSVLFAHGTADVVVPPAVSREAFEVASEPKQLMLIDGAGHDLADPASTLLPALRDHIAAELRRAVEMWEP